MGKPLDITGKRFGKLTAIKIDHLGFKNQRFWLCKCDCGNFTVQRISDLNAGKVKSCGCVRYKPLIDRNTSHNESKTRLYHIWRGIKTRCKNENHGDYKNYGGRGISICKEWEESYVAFRDWAMSNGYDDNLTIERKDVNGDYCPKNCCWIPKSEQCINKRNRKFECIRDEKGRFIKVKWEEQL